MRKVGEVKKENEAAAKAKAEADAKAQGDAAAVVAAALDACGKPTTKEAEALRKSIANAPGEYSVFAVGCDDCDDVPLVTGPVGLSVLRPLMCPCCGRVYEAEAPRIGPLTAENVKKAMTVGPGHDAAVENVIV